MKLNQIWDKYSIYIIIFVLIVIVLILGFLVNWNLDYVNDCPNCTRNIW